MKKLEKDLYIQHAKRLHAILDSSSSFIPYLNRPDFNATIRTELDVLAACERLFPKTRIGKEYSSKSLVQAFNKLTKESFTINTNYKYDDETDLIDSMNYLVTYCNNMFKVNLDDLVAGKKVTATDPHIDLKAKPQYDEDTPRPNSNFAFAGGAGIPLASTPYENPYLLGKAYAKLNDDIKQGKFYRYKTKPRIVPIMKIISVILMILLSLTFIATAVFAFMAQNLQVNVDGEALGLRTIDSGIIYIILSGLLAYPITTTLISLVTGKKKNNANLWFYFNWGFVLMIIGLSFLMIMLDLNKTWLLGYGIVEEEIGTIRYLGYQVWKWMFIALCAIIGANIIPVIIGSICNPKSDPNLIEKKIKEYVDLFSAESGQNPVPPKADVQKPTEVKDSKSKKDTKKK